MEQPFSIEAQILSEFIRRHFKRGEWTKRRGEAMRILLDVNRPATLSELSKKNEVIPTHPERLYQLATQWNLTDIEKFTGLATFRERETDKLPSGSANCAEIEVLTWGVNVLADPKYAPTNKYVAVYVDDVCFRQEDKDTGSVLVKNGKYIWIMPSSKLSGAVVLPVDVESGDVLLVNVYRHPQRRFLTEAPRGFGMLGVDEDDADTGRREVKEETGAIPLKNRQGVEALHFLKTLYTDTGKLWESPSYYLAFVNRELQRDLLNRREPTMEDPVWVALPAFYQAVLDPNSEPEEGVRVKESRAPLEADEFEYCLNAENRGKLNAHLPLDEGRLKIEDAFTTQVAFFAYRRLKQKFPELVPDLGNGNLPWA